MVADMVLPILREWRSNQGFAVEAQCPACGRVVRMSRADALHPNRKSCGCAFRANVAKGKTTHGGTYTPEFRTWMSMLFRCFNHQAPNFKNYGGRGITVCDRWRGSFQNFLDDMGKRPGSGWSLDRIDNDGNYEPGNCRWATAKQQGWNTRKIRLITFGGDALPIREWAKRLDVSEGGLRHKMRKLGSVEAAIAHYSTHGKIPHWGPRTKHGGG
jgi:hypothetical protein